MCMLCFFFICTIETSPSGWMLTSQQVLNMVGDKNIMVVGCPFVCVCVCVVHLVHGGLFYPILPSEHKSSRNR